VFTARYALSPYIKQIRFFFKGLILTPRRLHSCTYTAVSEIVFEDWSLLGCDTVSLDHWFPTFRRSVIRSFSVLKVTTFNCSGMNTLKLAETFWHVSSNPGYPKGKLRMRWEVLVTAVYVWRLSGQKCCRSVRHILICPRDRQLVVRRETWLWRVLPNLLEHTGFGWNRTTITNSSHGAEVALTMHKRTVELMKSLGHILPAEIVTVTAGRLWTVLPAVPISLPVI
jgi:hypothetical protein